MCLGCDIFHKYAENMLLKPMMCCTVFTSVSYHTSAHTCSSAPLPSLTAMSPLSPLTAMSPTEDSPTTEDPIQEHLAVIIGVPTGIGLAIIGLGLCVLWLGCSSYLEYRKNRPVSVGTHSTNVVRTELGRVECVYSAYM